MAWLYHTLFTLDYHYLYISWRNLLLVLTFRPVCKSCKCRFNMYSIYIVFGEQTAFAQEGMVLMHPIWDHGGC